MDKRDLRRSCPTCGGFMDRKSKQCRICAVKARATNPHLFAKVMCPKCQGCMNRGSRVCFRCRKEQMDQEISAKFPEISHETLTHEETPTGCTITTKTYENVRTLDDLVRVCEIDLETWEVERWVANKWEVAAKGKDALLHHAPLFQIKVWLKKRLVHLATKDEIASLITSTKEQITRAPIAVDKMWRKSTPGLALELSVPDLHMGKLAWSPETDHAHYDVKIAERAFTNAVDALLDRTSHYSFQQVIFPVGNDLLNADNVAGTTTGGTPQDSDSRFQKTFGAARRLITHTIERLREIAPVLVIMVPGNHDQLSVWHLGDSLDCYFHKHTDVTIDNAPTFRKYHQFGQVMLMFTHGDKGQKADYPLVMATERPMMWGTSTYREAHIGHLHRQQLQEFHGVKVRMSPALCAIDAWHTWQQFTGNNRSAEAFVWHMKEGLIGTAFYTVPEAV